MSALSNINAGHPPWRNGKWFRESTFRRRLGHVRGRFGARNPLVLMKVYIIGVGRSVEGQSLTSGAPKTSNTITLEAHIKLGISDFALGGCILNKVVLGVVNEPTFYTTAVLDVDGETNCQPTEILTTVLHASQDGNNVIAPLPAQAQHNERTPHQHKNSTPHRHFSHHTQCELNANGISCGREGNS